MPQCVGARVAPRCEVPANTKHSDHAYDDASITPEDVRGRSRAAKLAPEDPQEALKIARGIKHPWYRCQALATVAAQWGTHAQKLEVLEEALSVAQRQKDLNRIVTVSSWPLGVIIDIDPDAVRRHLRQLVDLTRGESHTLRRADALHALLVRVVSSSPPLLDDVVPALTEALLHGQGWHIDRLIRSTVHIIKGDLPAIASQLLQHHSDGKKKRELSR